MERDRQAAYVRFGAYELDLKAGELTKGRTRLLLPEQPFEVICLLLERSGQLVTREEIRRKLWPTDTVVEFDHSINTAIRRLRDALNDRARKPRYIETLPRRGYRFIANVEFVTNGNRPGADHRSRPFAEPPSLPRASGENQAAPDSRSLQAESLAADQSQTTGFTSYQPAPDVAVRGAEAAHRHTWFQRWKTPVFILVAAFLAAVFLLHFLARPLPPPRVVAYDPLTHDGSEKVLRIGDVSQPLLTDGLRVYFLESEPGGDYETVQVAASGGEVEPLSLNLLQPALLAIAPDGSQLLVASPGSSFNSRIFVAPLRGDPARPLPGIVAQGAGYSPDGRWIVYGNRSGLFRVAAGGGPSHLLARTWGTSAFYWPRWSPDGKTIRFTVDNLNTGTQSLWEISSDGRHLHPLLPRWHDPPHECCGGYTTDGKYFVFQSTRRGRTDLWAIPEKGGWLRSGRRVPVQLTSGPISFSSPAPGRDGRTIFALGEQLRGELVGYDPKPGIFSIYLGGISASGVDFTRNGKWVTYVAFPEGTLWRCRADGSQRLQLTFPPLQPFMPRWSPDGKQIAFYSQTPAEGYKIFVVAAQGGAPQQLIAEGESEIDPVWSPDGRFLAFSGAPWLKQVDNVAIHLLDLKTHRVSTLPGSNGLFSPRWSPDGRYLAALNSDSTRLMLFDFETGKWITLAAMNAAYPNWSRDGKYIYFERLNPPAIMRLCVSDRRVEQVISLRGRHRLWTLTDWCGLAPDDSPLLLRDVSSEQVYALKLNGL